jgi:hypothetical protein
MVLRENIKLKEFYLIQGILMRRNAVEADNLLYYSNYFIMTMYSK